MFHDVPAPPSVCKKKVPGYFSVFWGGMKNYPFFMQDFI